ncbi:MAG: YggS family pyridoxal phosphate-dependent enzyme [Elusimicrobiota bacterium]
MTLQENIAAIEDKIAEACAKSGRSRGDITLIAVTKTVPAWQIGESISLGIQHIGESKIQEAERKLPDIKGISSVKKHLIGHLQTNKAKKAVELFDVIQSLDSERLAEEINKQAQKLNKVQECLVELKVSEEESKFGLDPSKLIDFLNLIRVFGGIRVTGVMVMAPFFEDPEKTRPYFKRVKKSFDEAKETNPGLKELSMGMSNDFDIAVEEGATMVRIGTAIFKGSN